MDAEFVGADLDGDVRFIWWTSLLCNTHIKADAHHNGPSLVTAGLPECHQQLTASLLPT